jgi:hypothetical protein
MSDNLLPTTREIMAWYKMVSRVMNLYTACWTTRWYTEQYFGVPGLRIVCKKRSGKM